MSVARHALFLLLVGCAATSAAQDNLLTNGSFELQQQSGPTRVSMNLLDDWTNSGGFNLLEQGVNGTSGIPAQDGTQFVSMGHNSATGSELSQAFTAVPGVPHTLTFWTRVIQGSSTNQVLEVELASMLGMSGGASASVFSTPITAIDDWAESSIEFTPIGESATITFSDIVGAGGPNIALDNVSIVAIPEPASAGLALLGVLAWCRRR